MRATRRSILAAAVLLLAGACRQHAPSSDGRTAVWLDISPATGDPPRDPTDTMALVQTFGAERLRVAGVSVTFGKVPLVRGLPAAQDVMERIDTGGLRPWRGPSGPDERGSPTEATELLAEQLEDVPLTIVALGPLTTIAALLDRHARLATRVQRVVTTAGSGSARGGRDEALALDPESFQVLLDSGVPLTLVADQAGQASLTAADIDRLARGGRPARAVVPSARAWLRVSTELSGTDGFAPGGMLAVDVVAHPDHARCRDARAVIEWTAVGRAGPSAGNPGTGGALPALRVRTGTGAPGRPVTSCHPDAGVKERLLADVLRAGAPR